MDEITEVKNKVSPKEKSQGSPTESANDKGKQHRHHHRQHRHHAHHSHHPSKHKREGSRDKKIDDENKDGDHKHHRSHKHPDKHSNRHKDRHDKHNDKLDDRQHIKNNRHPYDDRERHQSRSSQYSERGYHRHRNSHDKYVENEYRYSDNGSKHRKRHDEYDDKNRKKSRSRSKDNLIKENEADKMLQNNTDTIVLPNSLNQMIPPQFDLENKMPQFNQLTTIPQMGYPNLSPNMYLTDPNMFAKSQLNHGVLLPNQINSSTLTNAEMFANSLSCPKCQREIYLGNIPPGINVPQLIEIVNSALIMIKANTQPGGPIVSCWISNDGHYAFAEFRSIEEANNSFQLNNIAICGSQLKVGRPKKQGPHAHRTNNYYTGSQAIQPPQNIQQNNVYKPQQLNYISNNMINNNINNFNQQTNYVFPPNTLLIQNLPSNYGEQEINAICSGIGQVTNVRLSIYGVGTASVTYNDINTTQKALQTLSGMKVREKLLHVVMVDNSIDGKQYTELVNNNSLDDKIDKKVKIPELSETKIIVLKNVVDVNELQEEYEEIQECIKEECAKYGDLLSLEMPKASDSVGAGFVFIEQSTQEHAINAYKSLIKKKFSDKPVEVEYYNELKYKNKDFSNV